MRKMLDKEIKQIVNKAKELTDEYDIYALNRKNFSVKINNQELDEFSYSNKQGIGIRLIIDGKVGYANTENLSEKTLNLMVQEAADSCKIIEKKQDLKFENFKNKTEVGNIYSENLKNVTTTEKIELVKNLEKRVKEQDERVFNVPYCTYQESDANIRIVNSKGMDKEYKSNGAYVWVMAYVKENEDVKDGFDFVMSRDFNKFDVDKMAKNAVEKAISLLNSKEVETKEYPIIFDPDSMSSLFSIYWRIFNSKFVQEGKSNFKDRIGEIVGSDILSIVDDGTLKEGFGSRPFDDEGFPTQRTVVVNKGKLSTFLYNTETAKVDNVKSTGNGSRSYKSNLFVGINNFYIEKGDAKKEELFNKYDEIIEIVSLEGLHSGANVISGDFSLPAKGFLWKNGKRMNSIKQFVIAGNFYDMLKNIVNISDEVKFSHNLFGSPFVLIKKLAVSC